MIDYDIKLVTDPYDPLTPTINPWGGAVGDGVTDDQDAFERTAAYIAAHNDTIFVPPGRYLLGEGNIKIANGALVGLPSPIDGGETDVGGPGPTILTPGTQTANPIFIMSRGSRLQGLRFYWPDQTGNDIYWENYPPVEPPVYGDIPDNHGDLIGSPTVYAPAIVTDYSLQGGTFSVWLEDLYLVNGYDGIKLGDENHECGSINMEQIICCCFNVAYEIWNASSTVMGRGLQDTHSIWKQGRVNRSGPLGWMARHGTAMRFNANQEEEAGAGLYLDEFWFRGVNRCFHVQSGKTGFCHFVNGGVERTPIFLDVEPEGVVHNCIFENITGHFYDASDDSYGPSVIRLDSDGSLVPDAAIFFNNFIVQEAQGRVIEVTSADQHGRLVFVGGELYRWGQHDPSSEYAIEVQSSEMDFVCNDVLFYGPGNSATARGVISSAAKSLTFNDCDFRNLDVVTSLTGTAMLDTRTSLGNVTTDKDGGTRRPLPIAPPVATIDANGAITVTSGYMRVQGTGASTDLKTVNGVSQGTSVTLLLANAANDVVVKDAAAGGNLHLAGDCTLSGQYDNITLTARNNSNLQEVARAINGN
jgi:hypothetical protein